MVTKDELTKANIVAVKERAVEMRSGICSMVRALRGENSQEWLEKASGVNRKMIGQVENENGPNYRIDTLLRVLAALKMDSEQDFISTVMEDRIVMKLRDIVRNGNPNDAAYLISTIERMAANPPLKKVKPAS